MLLALSRQLLLFLFAGITQVLMDWGLFVALSHLAVAVPLANLGSRCTAAAFGFWFNGRYTFAAGGRPRLDALHLRRYVIAQIALTALSTLLVSLVASRFSLEMAWLAKPLVEGMMAGLGFVVWRQWVYR
jgi:putative flippase GtrA